MTRVVKITVVTYNRKKVKYCRLTGFHVVRKTTFSPLDTEYNDNQHNYIQHNDTQHNDIQHKGLICDTQHK